MNKRTEMKLVLIGLIAVFFLGCSPLSKGDYVRYTSEEYLFVQDNFLDKSVRCLELGELKQGGMKAKYCLGQNYASDLVQGFIFEHHYSTPQERFIGARLSFRTKDRYYIPCASETVADANSGVEYINCMLPKKAFDVYTFIMSSQHKVHGRLSAAVGNHTVYEGVINEEGKELLIKFYQDLKKKEGLSWKKRRL